MQIILAGSHPLSNAGVKLFINSHFPESSLQILNDLLLLEDQLKTNNCDLVIYDAESFNGTAIAFLKQMEDYVNQVPFIIYLHSPDYKNAKLYLDMGIKAVLNKEEPLEFLTSCISTVLNGGKYVSSNLINDLFTEGKVAIPAPKSTSLTKRQAEIMDLILRGYKNGQICKELNLKPPTISTHKQLIMKRLGLDWGTIMNAEINKYVSKV